MPTCHRLGKTMLFCNMNELCLNVAQLKRKPVTLLDFLPHKMQLWLVNFNSGWSGVYISGALQVWSRGKVDPRFITEFLLDRHVFFISYSLLSCIFKRPYIAPTIAAGSLMLTLHCDLDVYKARMQWNTYFSAHLCQTSEVILRQYKHVISGKKNPKWVTVAHHAREGSSQRMQPRAHVEIGIVRTVNTP